MEKEIKLTFLRRLKISIIDFDKYTLLGAEGVKKAAIYLLELIAIFAIVISMALTYKANQVITEGCNYARETLPDFKLENNEFFVNSEENVMFEDNKYSNTKFILDNSDEEEKYKEEINNYEGNVLIFLKTKMLIKTSANIVTTQKYEDLQNQYSIGDITKSELIEKFMGDKAYSIYVNIGLSIFIINFITYLFSTIIDVLALSLLGIIIVKLIKIPLRYSAVLGMSASAITLPILLNMIYVVINTITGFKMQYFQVMYTLISYVYLITALLMIRAELIKKKNILKTTIKINTDKEKIEKPEGQEAKSKINENEVLEHDERKE